MNAEQTNIVVAMMMMKRRVREKLVKPDFPAFFMAVSRYNLASAWTNMQDAKTFEEYSGFATRIIENLTDKRDEIITEYDTYSQRREFPKSIKSAYDLLYGTKPLSPEHVQSLLVEYLNNHGYSDLPLIMKKLESKDTPFLQLMEAQEALLAWNDVMARNKWFETQRKTSFKHIDDLTVTLVVVVMFIGLAKAKKKLIEHRKQREHEMRLYELFEPYIENEKRYHEVILSMINGIWKTKDPVLISLWLAIRDDHDKELLNIKALANHLFSKPADLAADMATYLMPLTKNRDYAKYQTVTKQFTYLIQEVVIEMRKASSLAPITSHYSISSHLKYPSKLGVCKVPFHVVDSEAQVDPSLEAEAHEPHGFWAHSDVAELPVGEAHGLELLAGGLESYNVGEVPVEVCDWVCWPVCEVDCVPGLAAGVEDPEPDVGLELLELPGGDLPPHELVEVDALALLDVPPAEGGLEPAAPAVYAGALGGAESDEHIAALQKPLYSDDGRSVWDRCISDDAGPVLDPDRAQIRIKFDMLGLKL